jgi:hypothetical protein
MSVVERNFIGIIRKPINGLLHYKQLYWKKKDLQFQIGLLQR